MFRVHWKITTRLLYDWSPQLPSGTVVHIDAFKVSDGVLMARCDKPRKWLGVSWLEGYHKEARRGT